MGGIMILVSMLALFIWGGPTDAVDRRCRGVLGGVGFVDDISN